VNFILDADIRSFFREVSQQWVVRFLEHRIGDPRIIRLVQKWLRAGVLEDGIVTVEEKGTVQRSVISPMLSNVYLHYVFDLWAERWRRREATSDMIMVRYADDIIVGFQHESDARRFWNEMRDRLAEFSLSLHPDKTRLIDSGALRRRTATSVGAPSRRPSSSWVSCSYATSAVAATLASGRKSRGDRMRATLRELKEELR
jgi:retron-type reverse transcriptase